MRNQALQKENKKDSLQSALTSARDECTDA